LERIARKAAKGMMPTSALSSRRNNIKKPLGFTLFEILISITIVAIILGVVVGNMGDLFEARMKEASGKLASTMRYLYNKSATEGLYIRLILDMTDQVYYVEATSDPVVIENEGLEVGQGKNDKKKKELEEKRKAEEEKAREEEKEKAEAKKGAAGNEGKDVANEAAPATADADGRVKPKEPVFGPVDSFLLKPTKLPEGVFFKDVYVEHLENPVDGGKVAIHFFPNGYVEEAIINLKNEDEDVIYSLKTNPISGRVDIENSYRGKEAE
jgi:prepilin-type N-terminal cleavage/methylation domain-containing protein